MGKVNKGERCYLTEFRRLRYTEVSPTTYRLLQDSELYAIAILPHCIKVSFSPTAKEGYLIDKRSVMNEIEHYKQTRSKQTRSNTTKELSLRKEARDAWCKEHGVQSKQERD